MQPKFLKMMALLNSAFVERSEIVQGLVLALLTRTHVLLVGAPGAAKSALVRALCHLVGDVVYFEWLLMRTTGPDELFGPTDLTAYKAGVKRVLTRGKAPEAHLWFLDEVWKANSAILNGLLGALNERVFHNDGAQQIPLMTAIGASNEWKEGPELTALDDRWHQRFFVEDIRSDENFMKMLGGIDVSDPTTFTPLVSLKELTKAQEEIQKVVVPEEVIEKMAILRNELRQEKIVPSSRKFRQSLPLLKARAWLEGRKAADQDDLEVLANVLCSTDQDMSKVRTAVLRHGNPLNFEGRKLVDDAIAITQGFAEELPRLTGAQVAARVGEVTAKLTRIGENLAKMVDQQRSRGKSSMTLEGCHSQVVSFLDTIYKKHLGVDAVQVKRELRRRL